MRDAKGLGMVRRIVLVVGLAGLALAVPASASATVTIGTALGVLPSGEGIGFDPPGAAATFTQQDAPPSLTSPGGLRAPIDGVVVRWRIRNGPFSGSAALRIIRQPRPLSTASTGGGTGPTVPVPANQLSTYDVRLPIFTGNAVGIDCCYPNALSPFFFTSEANLFYWEPALIDNDPARAPTTYGSEALLVNADIEPDADHDGYGDETQDQCPADASTQGPCPQPQPGPTGQRAAALQKCKKTAKKKDWTKKRLKKCKQKANLLPV